MSSFVRIYREAKLLKMSLWGRWVVIFAFLLLATSAVQVIAAELPEPSEETVLPPTPADFDPSRLPGAADVSAAIEEAEREEEERAIWLKSPEAVQQREQSRFAFADLSFPEVRQLLNTTFAEQLAQLNEDPARILSEAQMLSSGEETSAAVKDEGNNFLLDSSLPVRTEDEEGNLAKVDLTLEETANGYETENGLVEVQIPESTEEPVEVGEEGVSIKLAGAEDAVAQPFGDQNVLAQEVLPDTDMLISPIATGVEIFNILRSEDSPETLRFQIGMPVGAALRAEGEWGAEVVKDGELISVIAEPIAVDAQGTDVPVDLRVEGNSLLLTVDHREGDYAMPILLDPQILENNENWIYGQNHNALDMGVWAYNNNGPWFRGSTYCIYECFGPGGKGTRGLFVSLEGQHSFGAQQFGQWSYGAPNINSYISSVTMGAPYVHADHACSEQNYPQPHNYFGVWSANLNSWVYLSVNSANQPGGTYTLPFSGDAAIFGLGTGGGIPWMPCWRDLYAGGAHVWLGDWHDPYLTSVGATPEGWVRRDGTLRTFNVSAGDIGLGVRDVRMFGVGTQEWHWNKSLCAGTRREPCPNDASGQIAFKTEGFPYEGRYNAQGQERKFSVQAIDPTGKTSQLERALWLDGTPPVVKLKGQLATATDQVGTAEKAQDTPAKDDELSIPTYKLEIEADDEADRSGVKEVKVFLDKDPSKEPNAAPTEVKSVTCSSAGCGRTLSMSYTLRLPGLTAGSHSLWIVAVDKVGNASDLNRNIEFEYIPATGMKEEYVLQHFRLPDGNDYVDDADYHGPEIAVNVMNGNVVFHERDVDVETERGDLELERVYNSQQPIQKDTQWGRGWSIAQAPELEPEPGPSPPQKATVVENGKITSSVLIPQAQSQTTFSSRLHATITKTASGYEVEPANTPEVTVFSNSGRVDSATAAVSKKWCRATTRLPT